MGDRRSHEWLCIETYRGPGETLMAECIIVGEGAFYIWCVSTAINFLGTVIQGRPRHFDRGATLGLLSGADPLAKRSLTPYDVDSGLKS